MKKKVNGKKFDNGKADYSLLPFDELEELVKVLMFGAKKYGRNNWKNGLSVNRLLSATYRHLKDFKNKTDIDKESGLHALGHVLANVIFMLWMIKNKPDFDDRD